jgi:hypothetical protein
MVWSAVGAKYRALFSQFATATISPIPPAVPAGELVSALG